MPSNIQEELKDAERYHTYRAEFLRVLAVADLAVSTSTHQTGLDIVNALMNSGEFDAAFYVQLAARDLPEDVVLDAVADRVQQRLSGEAL